MYYAISEEHGQLQRDARAFADEVIRPAAVKLDGKRSFPWEWFRACGDRGFLAEFFPPEYGGRTSSALGMVLAIEELSTASSSLGFLLAAHLQCCYMLLLKGSAQQKKRYLRPALRGETLLGFALTEEGAGSDVSGLSLTSVQQEDGSWLLSGSKHWITNAGFADCYLVAAKTAVGGGRYETGWFLVDQNTPGLSVRRMEDTMGMNNAPTGVLQLQDCRIPHKNLLGKTGDGLELLNQALKLSRLIISAVAAGGSKRVFECALGYTKEKVQFGRPISSFQGVSLQVADMYTKLDVLRTMLYHVAELWDQKQPHSLSTINLKVFSTDTFCALCDTAMIVMGGSGYSKAYEVERFLRDARALRITSSTPQICGVILQNYLYYNSTKSL